MSDRPGIGIVASAVLVIAVALRLMPLYWSRLPFNPDGIGYAASARDTLAAGQLPVAQFATDNFGFTALLTAVSAVTGQESLLIAQPVSAIVGGMSCLVAVMLARRLGIGLGWSASRTRLAALLAGLLLAAEGIYLHRSMATDEQTAGLLLVPLLAIAAHRALSTEQIRCVVLAGLIGLILPPLHNLTGLVGALVVTVLLVPAAIRQPGIVTRGRIVLVGGIVWVYALGYHLVVAEFTPAQIVQADRLIAAPGLFVAWLAVILVGVGWFLTTTQRIQRTILTAVVVGGFSVLAVNALTPIYPGTSQTLDLVLLALLPLVIPSLLATRAVPWAAGYDSSGTVVLSLIAGPLVFVGFSLTAGLTFDYLSTLHRSQLFAHLPLLVLAGLATASYFCGRSAVRLALIGIVLVSVVVSIPIAYSGLEALTYKGVTTPAEFEATEFAATELPNGWTTDDHLARVANYHGGSAARGEVRTWLRDGGPPPSCPTVAQESWTTTGGQFHPQQPSRIGATKYETWINSQNKVYATTSRDPLSVVLPRAENSTGC